MNTISLACALLVARGQRHIVLCGPSGSGKTTLAPLLAQVLGMAWADLDQEVESRAQKSIGDLFCDEGEPAFRRLEEAALRRLLRRRTPHVVALGGGTWHNPRLRQLLLAVAQEVLLVITTEEAFARLREAQATHLRPLVAGSDGLLRFKKLQAQRQPAENLCTVQVPVSQLTPEETVRAINRALCAHVPKRIFAKSYAQSYAVDLHDDGPRALVTALVQQRLPPRRILLATDATVLGQFAPKYVVALRGAGFDVAIYAVADGESSKNLQNTAALVDASLRHRISKTDAIVGLGGGMVLDLAAFAAAIFLRGVPFVAVATTSLAACDASLGGKCGINWGQSKNQVGAVRAPHAVIVDVAAVMAQPHAQRWQGAVEALKMGAVFSADLFRAVPKMGDNKALWQKAMAQAMALKAMVCRIDADERHLRHALNYGHTLGHAFESGSGWALSHGEAVALGMVAEAAFSEHHQLAKGIVKPLCRALSAMNMPIDWRRATLHSDALLRDKKGDGSFVVLPVVEALGQVQMHQISMAQLINFVRRT